MKTNDPLPESKSVWRYAMARRAHVVIDAAEYFEQMLDVMTQARQRIFLIGWDVDSRIRLIKRECDIARRHGRRVPDRLGSFMIWLVRRTPGLEFRVLKWHFGMYKLFFRGTMILDLIRWGVNRSIDFKLDSAHPLGCSHHQKIAVVDEVFAACGGIDMTSERWDTPEHLDEDKRRQRFGRGCYDPFHDVTMMMEGGIALALGELGRERWTRAGGRGLEACRQDEGRSIWPHGLRAEFENVEVGIARTRAAYKDWPAVHEVEELFVEQIGRARKFIYAENQYFCSRRVAEAISKKMSEPDPPEIVVVSTESADGWLEQAAMDGARTQLLRAIGLKDIHQRFRVFYPRTAGNRAIYVHAKLLIVDDEILRIGSANMNNRSMGLDSECDVFIDTRRRANAHAGEAITAIRLRLLAEHCGVSEHDIAAGLEAHGGSMLRLIESLPRSGKHLEAVEMRELTEMEKTVAEKALLDPESPEEMFEPIQRRRGLFRKGGLLRKPKRHA